MKTCPECKTSYPLSRVLCLHCSEILEESQYLRLIWGTLIVAVGFHFVLGKMGYPGAGLFSEAIKTGTLLLIACVLIWKLSQKIRSPERRVSYELASLYTSRTDRLLILALLGALFYLSLGFEISSPAKRIIEPEALVLFRKVRAWAVLGFGITYVAIVLAVQKLDFFNFKVSNSMLDREIRNAPANVEEHLEGR